MVGNYRLRYVVDTQIGPTEFTQHVRLEDKVSIFLLRRSPSTSRAKPSMCGRSRLTARITKRRRRRAHVRSGGFSRQQGFKKATRTDQFGVASAEFALADEVNLGTYHLRALTGEPDAPTNTAEIALNVERYVLPKFKVAVELSTDGKKQKTGFNPAITSVARCASTIFSESRLVMPDSDKALPRTSPFLRSGRPQARRIPRARIISTLTLPKYFAGRPLSQGAARVLIEATVKDYAGHSETRGQPITVSDSPLRLLLCPRAARSHRAWRTRFRADFVSRWISCKSHADNQGRW